MKKLLHIIILSFIALCFSGCYWGWGWLVPYSFQPSYWEFRELCKINNYPKSQEKYNRILNYFDKKMEYSDRIYLGVYIDYKNPNNKALIFENIDRMLFRPVWKSYVPQLHGHEGNMDIKLKFDGEVECKKFIKRELDG